MRLFLVFWENPPPTGHVANNGLSALIYCDVFHREGKASRIKDFSAESIHTIVPTVEGGAYVNAEMKTQENGLWYLSGDTAVKVEEIANLPHNKSSGVSREAWLWIILALLHAHGVACFKTGSLRCRRASRAFLKNSYGRFDPKARLFNLDPKKYQVPLEGIVPLLAAGLELFMDVYGRMPDRLLELAKLCEAELESR